MSCDLRNSADILQQTFFFKSVSIDFVVFNLLRTYKCYDDFYLFTNPFHLLSYFILIRLVIVQLKMEMLPRNITCGIYIHYTYIRITFRVGKHAAFVWLSQA